MENIEKVTKLLQKKKAICKEQFLQMEEKQITEYNDLMHTLQNIKAESNECIKSLSKNLQTFTMHKHSIYKLIHNSENILGLPISHNYHRQAITFLSEGIDFINKSQNAYKNFDDNNKENSTNLINDISFCTNSIGNELCTVEALIAKIKTLQRNTDARILLNCNDEDTEV